MPNSLYSPEPEDGKNFTEQYDRFYTLMAGPYAAFIKLLPLWRRWVNQALPELRGPRVLEVSFGTGYLLTQYTSNYQAFGIDYNRRMALMAKRSLNEKGLHAWLQVADVYALPYASQSFDSVLNTMAFSGYPHARTALGEITRVIKPGGRLVMIDIDYPQDRNWRGMLAARSWKALGDLLRDMPSLFEQFGYRTSKCKIGGYGSVYLYVASKI